MKVVLLALLRFYRLAISPSLGQQCRFYPSCSAYAVEAVAAHGVLRGARMAVWRLLRCNPWSKGGIDTVPPPGIGVEGAR